MSVSVRASTTDLEDSGQLSFFKARSSEAHFVYNTLLTKSDLLFKFIISSKPIFWHAVRSFICLYAGFKQNFCYEQ